MVGEILKREIIKNQTKLLSAKYTVGVQLILLPKWWIIIIIGGLYCIHLISHCERGYKKNGIFEL